MKPSKVLKILILLVAVLVMVNCLATVHPGSVPGMIRVPIFSPETEREAYSDLGWLRAINDTNSTYTEKFCALVNTAVCASCTQIKVCITATPDTTMDKANPRKNCPDANPYCSMTPVTGAICQNTPDPNEAACLAAKFNFPCTGIGFYPNPYTCQVYHYCSAQGATAQDYDCPDGYKFNSKANACVAQSGKCPTVTCPATANTNSIYQAYPDDTQYYVLCTYDTSTPVKITPYIFSCGQGAAFNPTNDQCVFTCPKEGYFVDTANPRQYYQCYLSSGRLVYKDKICMDNKMFNLTTNTCV